MTKGSGQRWRHALVAAHVVTTVGWMGQALAIFLLTTIGATAADLDVRYHAFLLADEVDNWVLIYLGNAGTYTGLVLSATTPWGFLRYWWVVTKFAMTVGQLALGIWVLDPHLATAAEAVRAGEDVATTWLRFGSLLMASGFAVQVWLAVAKPWGRTPWRPAVGRLPSAPRWAFVLALGLAAGDLALYLLVFHMPLPLLMMIGTAVFPLLRARWWPATGGAARRPAHAEAVA